MKNSHTQFRNKAIIFVLGLFALAFSFYACDTVTQTESDEITFDEFITENVKVSNELIEILRQEPNN